MFQVAKKAGLSRESLYRALSAQGNPSFATVLEVAGTRRAHSRPAGRRQRLSADGGVEFAAVCGHVPGPAGNVTEQYHQLI